MGFNNGGLDAYLANLREIDRGQMALGANVGINKEGADPERDYPMLVSAVSPFADYVTVNISSPNTPGLRDLQGEARLSAILGAIVTEKPIFVKIAPDLAPEGLEAVIGVCLARGVSGLIVSNTTIARPETLRGAARTETGGLSGAPLFAPSTAMLAQAYRLAGSKLTLIGVGGIFTAEDALTKIFAGASLVQVYTGFAYQGPPMIPKLKAGLAQLLRARGFKHIQEAVGAGS
jgi:dihydroorotate dehydrogenase